MCEEEDADKAPDDKPTIIIDGTVSFTEKEVMSMLSANREIVILNDWRFGKTELNTQVIKACIKEIDDSLLKSAKKQKEKPFYETLNDQKRRRSWRR